MPTKRPRSYAFVPRLLVRTAMVSVIPACAIAATDACGGSATSASKDAGHDAFLGVAAVAYPAYEAGSDAFFGVAAVAYPAYEAGLPETGAKDTGVKDAGIDVFGVAAVAYPAYEAGSG
ncbi:MAG TPA: hypothetical protein VGG39_26135 [Polyangiaceae bacterium]|jgi:hypothetical protein